MKAPTKHCAVSIDLDGLGCYYRIHGLGTPPAELEHVILERALPRAANLFAQRQLHVTWFVIGRDADGNSTLADRTTRAGNAQRLRTLADRGDELGNHSYSHPYDLARLAPNTIDTEIASCDRVLRDILGSGRAPRGFRAPGYDVAPAMLDTLARLGYRYDSSVFPAPGYYAAKAVVMTALAAMGRPSGAVLTNPKALAAPADPYRPSMTAPWRRGQAPLVELPIAVTPWTRMPAIGTTMLVAPSWARERMLDAMGRRRFFNLELHGIDFADADKDGIPGELVDRQPDLRIGIDDKLATLDRLLDAIGTRWSFATLAEVAADVQRDE
ncbi:MAG TPA: polysaccharide deacetylase family protein [Kofleriaceae bacterium]|nr:polysaccharide deacetylase family protein [Kofleriaceae bacterium]